MTTKKSKNGRSLRYEICKLFWPHVYTATALQGEFESDLGEFDGPWRDGDEEIIEAIDGLLSIRSRHEIFVKKMAVMHEKMGNSVADELGEDFFSRLGSQMPAALASKGKTR